MLWNFVAAMARLENGSIEVACDEHRHLPSVFCRGDDEAGAARAKKGTAEAMPGESSS